LPIREYKPKLYSDESHHTSKDQKDVQPSRILVLLGHKFHHVYISDVVSSRLRDAAHEHQKPAEPKRSTENATNDNAHINEHSQEEDGFPSVDISASRQNEATNEAPKQEHGPDEAHVRTTRAVEIHLLNPVVERLFVIGEVCPYADGRGVSVTGNLDGTGSVRRVNGELALEGGLFREVWNGVEDKCSREHSH
jgi:hypothetical protein